MVFEFEKNFKEHINKRATGERRCWIFNTKDEAREIFPKRYKLDKIGEIDDISKVTDKYKEIKSKNHIKVWGDLVIVNGAVYELLGYYISSNTYNASGQNVYIGGWDSSEFPKWWER